MFRARSKASALSLVSLLVLVGACSESASIEGGLESNVTDTSLGDWVKQNAKDVPSLELKANDQKMKEAFAGFVGKDVDIVGVGENAHGTHEYNLLRSKFFEYLVENHGFRAIVPETGIVESILVERYVQGAPDVTLEEALAKGFTHHMGLSAEAKDLVEWMRAYNEGKSPAQRVHFAGKDLSLLGDTLTVPLEPLAKYLEKVDPAYASSSAFTETMDLARKASAVTLQVDAAFRAQGANEINPDYLDPFTTISFEQLSAEDQERLAAGVGTIAKDVAGRASSYIAGSTEDDYRWNAQLAIVATQDIRDLRSRQTHPKIVFYEKAVELLARAAPSVVVDKRPASDPKSHSLDYASAIQITDYFVGRNAREEALADNVAWGQKRYGKMMNFAHIGHLNKLAQEKITLFGVEVREAGKVEGTFIAKAYGKRYQLIGSTNIDYKDAQGKPDSNFPAVTTSPESLEHEIDSVAREHSVGFFVDLTKGTVPAGLGKRLMRWNADFQEVDIRGNYDGFLVLTSVSPGHAIPGH